MSCVRCGKPDSTLGVRVCGQECADELTGVVPFGQLDDAVLRNTDYRRVAATTQQTQLVLMSILPSERGIPREIHPHTSQLFVIRAGSGELRITGQSEAIPLLPGTFALVPANTEHEVVVTGELPLKLYTSYSPPEHPADLVQHRRKMS